MSVVSECRKSNPSLVASVIEKYGLTQLTVVGFLHQKSSLGNLTENILEKDKKWYFQKFKIFQMSSDSWLKKKRKRTRSSQSETSMTNVEVAQVVRHLECRFSQK